MFWDTIAQPRLQSFKLTRTLDRRLILLLNMINMIRGGAAAAAASKAGGHSVTRLDGAGSSALQDF